MLGQTFHNYTTQLYQMEKREELPGTGLASELGGHSGLVGLLGRATSRTLERFPLREQGPTYVVFDRGAGYTIPYELLLMEIEIGRSLPVRQGDSSARLQLSQFRHLSTISVVSPYDGEQMVCDHFDQFAGTAGVGGSIGGSIQESRMGPVIRYAKGLTSEEMRLMADYYRNMDATFRPEKERHDRAADIAGIILEKSCYPEHRMTDVIKKDSNLLQREW